MFNPIRKEQTEQLQVSKDNFEPQTSDILASGS